MWRWIIFLAALTALLVAFPPVHIHKLTGGSEHPALPAATAETLRAADQFWTHDLPNASAQDLRSLVDLLHANPRSAELLGHTADIGGSPAYLIAGRAQVTRIDEAGVWLDVGEKTALRVVMLTNPIFGNALRDATGGLPMGRMSFSEYNGVSDELNRLSELEGRKVAASARVGATLVFRAAAEVNNSGREPELELAPIVVQQL